MGEPLLNKDLTKMVHDAKVEGFEVMLTTNGTLLSERGNFIFESGDVKKVSVSLQAVDIIDGKPCAAFSQNIDEYLENVADFATKCGKFGVICSLRLWNIEKEDDTKNDFLIEKLHTSFSIPQKGKCPCFSNSASFSPGPMKRKRKRMLHSATPYAIRSESFATVRLFPAALMQTALWHLETFLKRTLMK